ncbi:PKD domain-containing protein [Chryseobacterium sp. 18068]|uniref:Ig-like domain-containing protein n=1 Tax=Chryseobacterium sp. 18068 TaxID=2681414 RepID=UPI0013576B7B|nr:PKD domain-containing protein [Chryseobacterium sp. 18068]
MNATTYSWYKFSNATGLLTTGSTFTPTAAQYTLGSNTVYVQASSGNNCSTALLPVTFTVNAVPTNLEVTGNAGTYCIGSPVLLEPTATGGSGNIYEWSVTSNFVNVLGSSFVDANGNLSYTPSSSGTFIYYVRAKGIGGCYSDSKTVTFTVSNQVSNVTITPSNPSLCFGSNVTFTASATNATSFIWSTDNQSANVIGNSATITLQSTQYLLGVNTIYLKVGNAGGCNVAAIPVSFTVNPTPTNLIVTGNAGNYCIGNPILVTPTATGSGLIYEWSNSSAFTNILGAAFVDSNGKLNFNASTTGTFTYYVRAKGLGGCVSTTETVTFTINPNIGTVNITNQNAVVCNGQNVSFTAGATGASSYVWYKDSAGLVSIGNTQNISVASGDYVIGLNTIYIQVKGAGGCNSTIIPVYFTVNATPTNLVLAGNQSSYCSGSQILVTPSANGTGLTYQWSSSANFTTLLGSSLVDIDGRLNYIPSNIGTFTYYVRASNGAGCYSNVETFTFTVTQGVSNLQISNNNSVFCEGQTISFTAGATGATTFNWYKFANGTGLLHSGATFSPQPIDYTIGLNTLYVQAISSNSNCSTALNPVNFTVNEIPTAIAYTGETNYCLGQQVYIEPSALGNNLSYQWSTTANFASGNILGSSFVDAQGNLSYVPTTIGTKIYYVRAYNGSCYSAGIPVTIIVNTQPSNLAISKLTNIGQTNYCQNGNIEKYLATGVNVTNYKWYTDVNLTQEVLASYLTGNNNNTLNVDPSIWSVGTHNLYIVGENANGCKTLPQAINFSIIAGVSTITPSINNFSMCQSETRVVNIDNPNNFTINWYTNSAGTVALSNSFISNNGNTLTLPASTFTTGQTTLYYKVQNAGGCMSVLMPISFTVLASPANLTVTNNNASACMGQNLVFEASAQNASEFLWYKNYGTGLVAEPQYLSGTNNYKLTIPSGNFTAGTYTYTVIAKNSSGCLTAPIDVTFTVQSVPSNSTLTGLVDYCKSETVHFELVNSSPVSFKWFNDVNALNPVNVTYLSNNGAILNIPASTFTTGTHTLFYYATNGNCNSATQSITFTVKETPSNLNSSGNNGNYCSGNLIDIVVGSQGGATNYEWFEDSSASLQLNPIYIIGNNHERLQTSNYPVGVHTVYVRGVNGNGCKSALLPISFTVNAAPVINSFSLTSATVQTGTPINFGVAGTGYTRWKLLFNGSQVAPTGSGWNNGTITNYVYTNAATLNNAGNYTLIISNGTCEASSDFTVYVIPEITITHDKLSNIGVDGGVNKVILNQHDQITFSSSIGSTNAYSEVWDYGDGFNNTTVTGSHFYNNPGEFTVKLKVVNTINGDVFNVTYNLPILVKPEDSVVPTDTLNPPDTNYTVYPNPYKEFLGLKFTGQAGDKFIIRVYSISGISVFNADWIADGVNWDKKWYNPLLNTPQGTYIVRVNNVTKGTFWSAKLLKQ